MDFLTNIDLLTSIQNLMQYINDNWTTIIIIIGLALSLVAKIKNYLKLSEQEKIDIAKKQIKETMLKFVTNAEEDYYEWTSAGGIKRSQVIDEIFAKYPVLAKVTNQDELIAWIDETIDDALKTMRDIFEKQMIDSELVSHNNSDDSVTYTTSGYVNIE